ERRYDPRDVCFAFQQRVGAYDGCVALMAVQKADGGGRRLDLARRGRDQSIDLLERPVEPIEDAVEFHAHLISQRPAGVVIRRDRRPAGVGGIIRGILWFEHIHPVRAGPLPSFHHLQTPPTPLTPPLTIATS